MKKVHDFRPTKAIISLDAIRTNLQRIKQYVGETAVIAVVKANGYGHGDIEVARAVEASGLVQMMAVATPEEALVLREAGIKTELLIITPSPTSFAAIAAEQNIALAISNVEWLEQALAEHVEFTQPLKVHIKADCGMGRTGLRTKEDLLAIHEYSRTSERFFIEGMFMQFSSSDAETTERTDEQYKKFHQLVDFLPVRPPYVHAANSGATLLYPTYKLDGVRVGIAMYGLTPSDHVTSRLPFPLERAMSIESELSLVKQLPPGSPISYGGRYVTQDNEWIGTIPIGYADGLRRDLTGQEVLVDGERVPIVGSICMDQCMVRLRKEVPIGTKVTLIGRQAKEEITIEEWAQHTKTITHELIVSIGLRVPRIYQ